MAICKNICIYYECNGAAHTKKIEKIQSMTSSDTINIIKAHAKATATSSCMNFFIWFVYELAHIMDGASYVCQVQAGCLNLQICSYCS